MKKIPVIGTIAAILIMMMTTLSGRDTGYSLFMNTSLEHIIARVVLIVSLLVVVMSVRPRAHLFRATISLISFAIIIFTVSQTITYSLGLFDSFAYFLSSLILSVEALEAEDSSTQHTIHIVRS